MLLLPASSRGDSGRPGASSALATAHWLLPEGEGRSLSLLLLLPAQPPPGSRDGTRDGTSLCHTVKPQPWRYPKNGSERTLIAASGSSSYYYYYLASSELLLTSKRWQTLYHPSVVSSSKPTQPKAAALAARWSDDSCPTPRHRCCRHRFCFYVCHTTGALSTAAGPTANEGSYLLRKHLDMLLLLPQI